MIDYTCPICNECERYPDACDHPCDKYSDYKLNHYLTQQAENVQKTIERLDSELDNNKDIHIIKVDHLTPEKKEELKKLMGQYSCGVNLSEMSMSNSNMKLNIKYYNDDVTDIADFLEYTVEDPEYLQICNRLRMPNEIIDWKALLDYMTEKNRKYANDNWLCPVCRNHLVEKIEMEEIWGSKQISERYWICPHGCI